MEDSTADKVKHLREKHRSLDHHWSGCRDLNHNARDSDHQYKHHIARLRHIYKNHYAPDLHLNVHTTIAMEKERAERMSPLRKLYGKDGIESKKSEEKFSVREFAWDNDVQVPSQREGIYNRARTMLLKSKSSSSDDQSDLVGPGGRTGYSGGDPANGDGGVPGSSSSSRPTIRRLGSSLSLKTRGRLINSRIHQEDLTVLGRYRLGESEIYLYEAFVSMLREMDPHDMVLVLEDATKDVISHNSLEAYGGTDIFSRNR